MKKVLLSLFLFCSLLVLPTTYGQSDASPPVASSQERVDCVAAAISSPAENPCPPTFVQGITPGSKWTNLGWIALGILLYFTMLYKMKKWKFPSTDFRFGHWITDNWPNMVFFIAGVFIYMTWEPEITSREAFALGLAPNFFIDFIQKFFEKTGKT